MTNVDSTVLFKNAVEDINYQGSKNGFTNKVNAFGHEWVVARLSFARSAIEGVVDAVYHAALTLFRLVLSAATLFLNKNLRDQTSSSFKDLGTNLETVVKSVAGVVCPHFGKWLDQKIHSSSQPSQPVAKEEVIVVTPAVVTA